jgi:hypothetical protein
MRERETRVSMNGIEGEDDHEDEEDDGAAGLRHSRGRISFAPH